jgi:hypothetical protein
MDVNVAVDTGKNLTSLIEQLAQQIGVTADKVIPWYVQQAYIVGITTIIGLALALLVFGSVFAFVFKKADFDDGNRYTVICIFSGICFAVSLVGGFFGGVEATRHILNPNYYAMQMITRDIGRLAGR